MTYALVQIQPLEVLRVYPDMPERVDWPDGAASHAIGAGFRYQEWAFVEVKTIPDQPTEFHSIGEASHELSDNTLTITRIWVEADLSLAKDVLRARVDEQAEEERKKHLTVGSGQALVYHQKLLEALAAQSDNSPSVEKYPLLNATVGIEGTLKEVADKVIQQSRKWSEKASEIERHRIGSKTAISAAKSAEEAVSAAQVTWP